MKIETEIKDRIFCYEYDSSFTSVWVEPYVIYKYRLKKPVTGIKKLIQLFAYLNEMVEGGIVFIDEFDSNIHDVYLCALLEYLMEYGKGQLCFTTHNVGPMDVLKHHKKSIADIYNVAAAYDNSLADTQKILLRQSR